MGKQLYLFGEEVNEVKHRRREDIINDYDGFVEKFKPKKTTDDCYTPVPVYSALVKYINENVQCLNGFNIIRPFWPGRIRIFLTQRFVRARSWIWAFTAYIWRWSSLEGQSGCALTASF